MLMEVTCRCGWSTRGSRAEVICMVQAHALAEHQLELTPQEIRAVWRTVEDAPATSRQPDERD